jgi:hypothetical protein
VWYLVERASVVNIACVGVKIRSINSNTSYLEQTKPSLLALLTLFRGRSAPGFKGRQYVPLQHRPPLKRQCQEKELGAGQGKSSSEEGGEEIRQTQVRERGRSRAAPARYNTKEENEDSSHPRGCAKCLCIRVLPEMGAIIMPSR